MLAGVVEWAGECLKSSTPGPSPPFYSKSGRGHPGVYDRHFSVRISGCQPPRGRRLEAGCQKSNAPESSPAYVGQAGRGTSGANARMVAQAGVCVNPGPQRIAPKKSVPRSRHRREARIGLSGAYIPILAQGNLRVKRNIEDLRMVIPSRLRRRSAGGMTRQRRRAARTMGLIEWAGECLGRRQAIERPMPRSRHRRGAGIGLVWAYDWYPGVRISGCQSPQVLRLDVGR